MRTFRNNGAKGALLDEYERAIDELKQLISSLSNKELCQIVDPDTDDQDCKSIQTILAHVVRAGYNYVFAIRKHMGEPTKYRTSELRGSVKDYQVALDDMFCFNEKLFSEHPGLQLEESDPRKKIKVKWGNYYDVEQLFEHAIVHVLRHRRQIERFIQMIKESDQRS